LGLEDFDLVKELAFLFGREEYTIIPDHKAVPLKLSPQDLKKVKQDNMGMPNLNALLNPCILPPQRRHPSAHHAPHAPGDLPLDNQPTILEKGALDVHLQVDVVADLLQDVGLVVVGQEQQVLGGGLRVRAALSQDLLD
jgi:hypothetical protein